MILHHFHAKPLEGDFPTYEQTNHQAMKPNGFWLSDETPGNGPGWREWCEAEGFRTYALAYSTTYEVDMERVLLISTPDQLFDFGEEYRLTGLPDEISRLSIFLDWPRVARVWAGVLITPYQVVLPPRSGGLLVLWLGLRERLRLGHQHPSQA